MVIPIHIYPVIMQKCLPFIMYCEVCCQVNCLQTCERMSAYWAIEVYVFVKTHKGECHQAMNLLSHVRGYHAYCRRMVSAASAEYD